MQKDHRPYPIKKNWLRLQKFYAEHFLRPQFAFLGKSHAFMRPWYVEIFGAPVSLGHHATVIATADKRVRFAIWGAAEGSGFIEIGDYSLISPGVRFSAAVGIRLGHNCMLANGVYITDCDWHGLYDRVSLGEAAPVTIGDNVWIGDGAIVCKGVRIGENSVVGAGAVVVKSLPANVIAAGNPAAIVKALDPNQPRFTRGHWFKEHRHLARELAVWDRAVMANNTLLKWLRSVLFPRPGD